MRRKNKKKCEKYDKSWGNVENITTDERNNPKKGEEN